jgi:hypothetical protein
MDENWISLSIATDVIARNFQIHPGIAQRRIIDAINEGVRARGITRYDVFDFDSRPRWPSRPDLGPQNLGSGKFETADAAARARDGGYVDLSPSICTAAFIDWERCELRHPQFSGKLIGLELEKNDFGHWYRQALKSTTPPQRTATNDEPGVEVKRASRKGGAPPKFPKARKWVSVWLVSERTEIERRDELSTSDAHERLRQMGLRKIAERIETRALKGDKRHLLPKRTRLRELISDELAKLVPPTAGN